MRFIQAAAVYGIVMMAAAQGLNGSIKSLAHLDIRTRDPAVGVTHANATEAARRHDWDFRADVPPEGQFCTPSPLWAEDVDPAKYEIGCKEVEDLLRGNITFVGQGNIREVYIAPYKGRSVALKLLKTRSEAAMHEHWVELVTTDAVKGAPHVVDMLGFCDTTVVTEVYTRDVKILVHRAEEPFAMSWVLSMSLDAAVGLRALHEAAEQPIVHFDVKLSQLVIQDNGRVRLADYNLAYFMGKLADGSPCPFNKKSPSRNGNGRKSPEFAAGEPMTEKVDIYRMGLVYAAIISAGRGIKFHAKRGDIPVFDPSWHEGYVQLTQEMLGGADQRPSVGEVVSRLQAMQEELVETP